MRVRLPRQPEGLRVDAGDLWLVALVSVGVVWVAAVLGLAVLVFRLIGGV